MTDDLILLAKYTPELLFKWKLVGGANFMPIGVFAKLLNAPQGEDAAIKVPEKTHQNLTLFVIPNTSKGKFVRYMFRVDPNDSHWRDRLTREVYYSMQQYHPSKGYSGVSLQFTNEELNDGDHVRATYSAVPLKESIPAAPAYSFQPLANVLTSSSTRRSATPEERAQERFADYREACATKLAANIKAKFGDRPVGRSDLKRAVITSLHSGDMMSKIQAADIKKTKIQVSSAISSDICASIQRVDAARMKSKGIDLETAHKTAILGSPAWDCVKSWFTNSLNKPKPADENIAVSHSDYSDNEDERAYRRQFNPSLVRPMPTVQSVSYTAAAAAPVAESKTRQVGEQRAVFNLRQINKSDLVAHKERRTVYLYPIQKAGSTASVQADREIKLYPIQKGDATASVQADREIKLYPIQKGGATASVQAARKEEDDICLVPIKKVAAPLDQVQNEQEVDLLPLDDDDEEDVYQDEVILEKTQPVMSAALNRPVTFSLLNASGRRINLSTDCISQEMGVAKFVGPIRVSSGAEVDGKRIGAEHDGTTVIYNGRELVSAPQTAQPGQTSVRFTNLCNDKAMRCQIKSHLGTVTMLGSSYAGVGSGCYTITISGDMGAAKVENRVVHQGNSYTIYAVPYGNRNAIVMATDRENINHELVKQMGSVRGKEGHMFVGNDCNFGHIIKNGLRMTHSSDDTSRHVAQDGRVFDVTERRNGVYDRNENIKSVIGMWHHPENPKLTVIEYNGRSTDLPLDG